MAVTIFLKAQKEKGQIKLHLRDSEGNEGDQTITTSAKQGEKICWRLDENSDIKEIENVYRKDRSGDVFSTDPFKVSDEEWQGIIAQDAVGREAYNIRYKYKNDSVITDDPNIQIKPPRP